MCMFRRRKRASMKMTGHATSQAVHDDDNNVDVVRLDLGTAATNGPTVHPPGGI
jgi:hypothetical protein